MTFCEQGVGVAVNSAVYHPRSLLWFLGQTSRSFGDVLSYVVSIGVASGEVFAGRGLRVLSDADIGAIDAPTSNVMMLWLLLFCHTRTSSKPDHATRA